MLTGPCTEIQLSWSLSVRNWLLWGWRKGNVSLQVSPGLLARAAFPAAHLFYFHRSISFPRQGRPAKHINFGVPCRYWCRCLGYERLYCTYCPAQSVLFLVGQALAQMGLWVGHCLLQGINGICSDSWRPQKQDMNMIPHSLRYERDDIQIFILWSCTKAVILCWTLRAGCVQSSLKFVVFSFLLSLP